MIPNPDVELAQAVTTAIENAVAQRQGFVTKWVAVIEAVDQTGSRALWTLNSPEAAPWETLGLLSYSLQAQQVDAVWALDDSDGDSDDPDA